MADIKIEITSSGDKWWAYIIEQGWSIHGIETKDKSIIGRCFPTNQEAWQWAMRQTERLR